MSFLFLIWFLLLQQVSGVKLAHQFSPADTRWSCINADAMTWHCTDVYTMLPQRHEPPGRVEVKAIPTTTYNKWLFVETCKIIPKLLSIIHLIWGYIKWLGSFNTRIHRKSCIHLALFASSHGNYSHANNISDVFLSCCLITEGKSTCTVEAITGFQNRHEKKNLIETKLYPTYGGYLHVLLSRQINH